jgi:hypothetical protein
MRSMFRGTTLPASLTKFPEGFGCKATNTSYMFAYVTMSADIDWSATTFDNRDTLDVTEMFFTTKWSTHTITVKDVATQTKFTTGTEATTLNIVIPVTGG